MYRGAERHGEPGHILVDPHAYRALEGHRDGRGRGLCAEGGEIGRHHGPQQPEWVARYAPLGEKRCHGILPHKQQDMKREYHQYYLQESRQDRGHLAGGGHPQEYAEDIDRQQRHYGLAYHHVDYRAELAEQSADDITFQTRRAKPHDECGHQRRHHTHQRRYRHREPGSDLDRPGLSLDKPVRDNHPGEEHLSGGIRQHPRAHRGEIGQQGGGDEHLARLGPDVGDRRGHEPHDYQRDAKPEKFAEQLVEGGEHPCGPHRQHPAAHDAEGYRHHYPRQQSESYPLSIFLSVFHGYCQSATNVILFSVNTNTRATDGRPAGHDRRKPPAEIIRTASACIVSSGAAYRAGPLHSGQPRRRLISSPWLSRPSCPQPPGRGQSPPRRCRRSCWPQIHSWAPVR